MSFGAFGVLALAAFGLFALVTGGLSSRGPASPPTQPVYEQEPAQPAFEVLAATDPDADDDGVSRAKAGARSVEERGSSDDMGTSPLSLHDGDYQAGGARVSVSQGESLVGQSYEVNGHGGGCQVFGAVGPTTVNVVDGEWWEFDQGLSRSQLESLMADAEASGESDPAAQCRGGWTWWLIQ